MFATNVSLHRMRWHSALLCIAITLLNSNSASAARPPVVIAEQNPAHNHQVSLWVKAAIKKRSRRTRLVIARATNQEKSFTTIIRTRMFRRINLNVVDQVSDGYESVTYRSRLRGKFRSKWSKPLSVKFQSSALSAGDSSIAPVPIAAPSDIPTPSMPELPAGISNCPEDAKVRAVELVNIARANNGKRALIIHPALSASSLNFSIKMANQNKMAHDGWYENIRSNGYNGHSYGQNIGYMYYLNADEITGAWMNSAPHRQNILAEGFSYIGIGCVIDNGGYVWWTQDFGG